MPRSFKEEAAAAAASAPLKVSQRRHARQRPSQPLKLKVVTMERNNPTEASFEGTNIKVAVRMRPSIENGDNGQSVWRVDKEKNNVVQLIIGGKPLGKSMPHKHTVYSFDNVFDVDATSKEVYDAIAKDIVQTALAGVNGTIVMYGQSGSGKTFTMQGPAFRTVDWTTEDGFVHFAAAEIFQHIRATPERKFTVRASVFEIYDEDIYDLLPAATETVEIREDPLRGVVDIISQDAKLLDLNNLQTLLEGAEMKRWGLAAVNGNRLSSSHTILRIAIESRALAAGFADRAANEENGAIIGALTFATLDFVALSNSEGVRLTEMTAKSRNEAKMFDQSSLVAFTQVISALGDPSSPPVSCHNTKLTRILKPSLMGNARLAIVCCAIPSYRNLKATQATLSFAMRAKLIKTCARVNVEYDDKATIRQLRMELAAASAARAKVEHDAKATIHQLSMKLAAASAARVNVEYDDKATIHQLRMKLAAASAARVDIESDAKATIRQLRMELAAASAAQADIQYDSSSASSAMQSMIQKPLVKQRAQRGGVVRNSDAVIKKAFTDLYEINFGASLKKSDDGLTVVCSCRHLESRKLHLVKIFDNSELSGEKDRAKLKDEIYVLRELHGAPRIIQLVESFCMDNATYMVMEPLTGDTVWARMKRQSIARYSEYDARRLALAILSILAYCHGKKIAICNVTAESFICIADDDNTDVVLADLSCATPHCWIEALSTVYKPSDYLSPEMLFEQPAYDWRCDNWSVGVLLHYTLTGHFPFRSLGQQFIDGTMLNAIRSGHFANGHLEFVSDEGQKLVQGLLNIDPGKRWTANEALAFVENSWLPTI
ncbi:hypothetical protein MPSEU_000819100 [Mayamaea pseudoterrestris]|nr:hypothetical protein MPSEU_000819100 [Mayamaea pseudoterrestris]